MTWDLQHPTALWVGLGFLAVGTVLSFCGEMGWLFGLPFDAVGLGTVAAAYTKVGP